MKRTLLVLAAATVTLLDLSAIPALAQTRVFVSGFGSDANPCSLAAPCRSFQQAHDTVAAGGEIVALDSAGYGPLTISKAVTITAVGVAASITSNIAAANSMGVSINAGSTDVVNLRGLSLFSGSNVGNGIDIASAKSVTIRDCTISGFPAEGIFAHPNASLDLDIRESSADNNHATGLYIFPSGSGAVTVYVNDSHFRGNTFGGISVDGQSSTGTITATLSADVAATVNPGIEVGSSSGKAQPVVMITGSKLANVGIGVNGVGNVKVYVDRTQISGSLKGWQASSGAAVTSYTNNQVNGNGDDGLNGVVQINPQ